MYDFLTSLVLGIVQGLTEFLPVSSSGHIELVEALFGVEQKDSILTTIILHAATALATVVVYRKFFVQIFKGLFQFKWNDETKFSLHVIISMIPAALVGLFFEDQLDAFFDGNIILVGLMLLLTGVLLFFADKAKRTEKNVEVKSAFWIGLSQAIAILPGISRSGATISTSVLLGIDREKAARFSFIMVIPLILGVILKKYMELDSTPENFSLSNAVVGFVAAFVTGILACNWMIRLVKRAKLSYFAYYCFLVGAVAIIAHMVSS